MDLGPQKAFTLLGVGRPGEALGAGHGASVGALEAGDEARPADEAGRRVGDGRAVVVEHPRGGRRGPGPSRGPGGVVVGPRAPAAAPAPPVPLSRPGAAVRRPGARQASRPARGVAVAEVQPPPRPRPRRRPPRACLGRPLDRVARRPGRPVSVRPRVGVPVPVGPGVRDNDYPGPRATFREPHGLDVYSSLDGVWKPDGAGGVEGPR